MRKDRHIQALPGTAWLGIVVCWGLWACDGRDAYTVVKIDPGSLPMTAKRLRVDTTVGSLSAQECYKEISNEVAFWLPYGTLHFEEGDWRGKMVAVQVQALDGNNYVVASGSDNREATYMVRLELMVRLKLATVPAVHQDCP